MKSEFAIATAYKDVCIFLAQQDVKSRFRRSKLGVLWLVINQLVFSLGAGIIWSKVLNIEPSTFIPFLTVGFISWSFISNVMIEGCNCFIIAQHYLKQLPLPQSLFIFRSFLVNSFYFSIGVISCFFILLVFNKLHLKGIILSLPGFVILLLYFYGAIGAMAYLGMRYRDIQHALPGIFSLLFMVTPVMYSPEVLIQRKIAFIIYLNPFASLIENIRSPLLYNVPPEKIHYFTSIAFTIIIIIIRFMLQKKWERLVPFWS